MIHTVVLVRVYPVRLGQINECVFIVFVFLDTDKYRAKAIIPCWNRKLGRLSVN